jgi:hypothetical protein
MATFSVNETARRVQYISTGQTTYNFNFQVNAASELQVYVNDTLQVDSVAYSATISSSGSGSITFINNSGSGGTNYTPSNGDYITIIGDLPLSRTTSLNNAADITTTNLDTELDNTLFRQQQLKEMMDRSIQLKVTTPRTVTSTGTNGPLQFPYDATVSNNADKLIAYDSNGTSLILGPTSAGLTTLSTISTEVQALAAKTTEIGRLGTTDAVADMNTLGTADVVSDMNTLATADVVADMNTLGTSDVVSDMNTLATSQNVTNMNTLAGISSAITGVNSISSAVSAVNSNASNINAVNSNSSNINAVAGKVTEIGLLGTSDAVADMALLGTSDVVADMALLATSDVIADMAQLASSDFIADLNTLATSDIVTDMNLLATTANVNNMATLGASGVVGNIATTAGSISNINSVAGSISNVNSVASNISSVNSFANTYRISANAPTSSLDVGDLWFDTTNNVMKVYASGGFITAASAVNGTANRFTYTATANQTTFTGSDDNSNTLAYDAGFVDIYLNGIKLVSGGSNDYVASNGTSVVLNSGAAANDILQIVAYGTFELANFSINAANNVNTTGLATNDLLRYDGTNFVPKSFDEITPSQSSNSGKFLTTDGTNSSWGTVNTNLVADTSPQLGGNLDGNGNTIDLSANTTHFNLPRGTTAQQVTPSAANEGAIRYDTDDDVVYYSTGSSWVKIASAIPTLSGVTGSILVGAATTLTLAGTNFLTSNLVVNFTQTSDSINEDVTVTPTSQTAATVSVPAAVYNNVTAGNAVTIKVTNSDAIESNTQTITATALPSGGTITSSGGYRYHKFTSSGTFTQTLSKTVEYLIVAGGGAGGGGNSGTNRIGGGGGAGGLKNGSVSTTPQSYTITIGAGGSGNTSNQGNPGGNSSALSVTSTGGGGGGSGDSGVQNGGSGGSGGGAGRGATGGSGTSGQGNNGGNSVGPSNPQSQGGGGGAGAAGNNGSQNNSNGNGNGGAGTNSYSAWATATSSGDSGYFAGGGGGGWHGSYTPTTNTSGGAGGGGDGGDSSSDNSNAYGSTGTGNTGGGGGGNSTTSPHAAVSSAPNGPAGGSGIVILRYQL